MTRDSVQGEINDSGGQEAHEGLIGALAEVSADAHVNGHDTHGEFSVGTNQVPGQAEGAETLADTETSRSEEIGRASCRERV